MADEKPDPKDFLHDTDPPMLVDDHQAVELIRDGDMLRRVIVCCDCGLVHLMSVNSKLSKAYFVREDGPAAEAIRQGGVEAGHRFVLLSKLADSEAARAKAEELSEQRLAVIGEGIRAANEERERAEAAESRLRRIKEAVRWMQTNHNISGNCGCSGCTQAYRAACEEGERG